MVESKCSDCGAKLTQVSYVEPDILGHYTATGKQRPPLCESCWKEHYFKATGKTRAMGSGLVGQ